MNKDAGRAFLQHRRQSWHLVDCGECFNIMKTGYWRKLRGTLVVWDCPTCLRPELYVRFKHDGILSFLAVPDRAVRSLSSIHEKHDVGGQVRGSDDLSAAILISEEALHSIREFVDHGGELAPPLIKALGITKRRSNPTDPRWLELDRLCTASVWAEMIKPRRELSMESFRSLIFEESVRAHAIPRVLMKPDQIS